MGRKKCEGVIASDSEKYGFSQFLIDANNAAATCYYEASSQNLYGHQYMHNPDVYGYFQFAPKATNTCGNVQWLARFTLAQIYQAEIQFVIVNDRYTSSLTELLTDSYCKVDDACDMQAMVIVQKYVHIKVDMGGAHSCAKYATASNSTTDFTGGPCFTATAVYSVQSKADASKSRTVIAKIDEARHINYDVEVGQSWNDVDSDWLCLDSVQVVRPTSLEFVV